RLGPHPERDDVRTVRGDPVRGGVAGREQGDAAEHVRAAASLQMQSGPGDLLAPLLRGAGPYLVQVRPARVRVRGQHVQPQIPVRGPVLGADAMDAQLRVGPRRGDPGGGARRRAHRPSPGVVGAVSGGCCAAADRARARILADPGPWTVAVQGCSLSRGSPAAPATARGGAAWTWSWTRSGGSAPG